MRLQINRFLLILMLLVLPVQAFASAAMLGCAFSHQGQTSHAQAEKSVRMGEPPATCHEPKQTEKSPTSPACTHCATCYLASALPVPAVDAGLFFSVTHSVIPHADDAFIGFIQDSPERPPRILFA